MADNIVKRDHIANAMSLIKLCKANRAAEAQSLLDSYTTPTDQSGLSGSLVTVALALTAYVDSMGKDLTSVKPGYPLANSDDVLARIELLLSPPADNKAGNNNSRSEPISYL